MSRRTRQPEREMALRALVPGLPAAGIALGLGSIVRPGVGASAALGVLLVLGSFIVNALALGWARTHSLTAIQVVAFSSFLVRLALVGAVFFALKATGSWFSLAAFGGGILAIIPVALYEAVLMRKGPIAEAIAFADVPAKERA